MDAIADEYVSAPTNKVAHAGTKVSSLVKGMVVGADSIDYIALLRHNPALTLFDRPYAPSTLGRVDGWIIGLNRPAWLLGARARHIL